MCSRSDHQLGIVLDSLQQSGRYEDAAIFFFSDHGDFAGDYGLVEKTQNTFEDCLTRVPFLIKPPADLSVVPGISDALVELLDLPATIYDLIGCDPQYTHFGRSLLPIVKGERTEHRDAVFSEGGRLDGEHQATEHHSLDRFDDPKESQYWPRLSLQTDMHSPYHTKAAMCRTKSHKYVMRLCEKDELYDMRRDPGELSNVIDDPGYADIKTRLRGRLLRWYMETADAVPFDVDQR
jgi:arylsulfatase A-like enzyme